MTDRYFDDFAIGERIVTQGVTVTQSMIIDFALRYDPQPFHLDVEAARQSNYGGLIASGFQTLALGFRMVIETGVFRAASMGSPGFDELRWVRPFRPGDRLDVIGEEIEQRPSASKPDRGLIRVYFRYVNQNGEDVLTMRSMHLFRRRPAA